MFKTKLERIFKRKSDRNEVVNYTFETIPLYNFKMVVKGELQYMNESAELNGKCEDDYFKLKDDYLALMGGDTNEYKRYKKVCYNYLQAMCVAIQADSTIGSHHRRVNELYRTKVAIEKELFQETENYSELDYDDMIAKVMLRGHFHIDQHKWTAKEFFTIIKALKAEDGTDRKTNG